MRWKRRKMIEVRSGLIFGACTVISGAAALFGMNVLSVMAEESAGEEMVVSNNAPDTGENELSENALNTGGDENLGVYDFKDNKTTGTVTVTKVWDDDKTNEERVIPDIKISTEKPSKSTLGYTVTFHGNGAYFADDTVENQVLYNSSGQIISGNYKTGTGIKSWCYDKECTQQFDINEDGTLQSGVTLNSDIDVYAKLPTFELNTYSTDSDGTTYSSGYTFCKKIPENTKNVVFCDEEMPAAITEIEDMDADGDGGVVAWTDGETMKVSTQVKGQKVKIKGNADSLFAYNETIEKVDFNGLDTSELTTIKFWFERTASLRNIDMSMLDLKNVKDAGYLFASGGGPEFHFKMTERDMPNLTEAAHMFSNVTAKEIDISGITCPNLRSISSFCIEATGLTSLRMDEFYAPKLENADHFLYMCKDLTYLSMDNVDLSGVKHMVYGFSQTAIKEINTNKLLLSSLESCNNLFYQCPNLNSLTFFANVEIGTKVDEVSMSYMFAKCPNLESVITESCKNTNWKNITKTDFMFSEDVNIKIAKLNNIYFKKASQMNSMFGGCTSLTELDFSGSEFDALTSSPFSGCDSLKTINMSNVIIKNVQKINEINLFYLPYVETINLQDTTFNDTISGYNMFGGCSSLKHLNLNNVNFPKLTVAVYMFSGCSSISELTLKNIQWSELQTVSAMFGSEGINKITLKNICMNKVTDANKMFVECKNLTDVIFSEVQLYSVTSTGGMFSECTILKSLEFTDVDFVSISFAGMFAGCQTIESVVFKNISIMDIIDSTNAMFYGCSKLKNVDLSGFNMENTTNMSAMFYGCSSLENLDLTSMNTTSVTNMNSMFYQCDSLTVLKTGEHFKFVGANYSLPGTWRNTAGETFTSGTFPSNVADTYTKISD